MQPYMKSGSCFVFLYFLPHKIQLLTEAGHTMRLGRPLASAQAHIAAVATSASTTAAANVGVTVFVVLGRRKAHWRTRRTLQLTVG